MTIPVAYRQVPSIKGIGYEPRIGATGSDPGVHLRAVVVVARGHCGSRGMPATTQPSNRHSVVNSRMALSSDLNNQTLYHVATLALPERSQQVISSLLEKLQSEGIESLQHFIGISKELLERKLSQQKIFTFADCRDVLLLWEQSQELFRRWEKSQVSAGGRRVERSRSPRLRQRSRGCGNNRGSIGGQSRLDDMLDSELRTEPLKQRGGSSQRDSSRRIPAWRQPPHKSELWAAVQQGDETRVNQVITHGCDVNETFQGWTPLMKASEEGHVTIMQVLIDANADIEARNKKGRTALSFAAAPSMKRPTQEAAMKLLLNSGADANSKDDLGNTPVQRAKMEKRKNALEVFQQFGHE